MDPTSTHLTLDDLRLEPTIYLLSEWETDEEALRYLAQVCLKPKRTSVQAPWQNGIAERWIGSCRRELLDHVIALGESHLRGAHPRLRELPP